MGKKKIYNGGLIPAPVSRTLTAPAILRKKYANNSAVPRPEVVLEAPRSTLFSKACINEATFVKEKMIPDNGLLKKVKEELNLMLTNLRNIVLKVKPELGETGASKLFLSDEIMGYIGNIGTENPLEKWAYLTRSPNEDPHNPPCRVKITALHNFIFSENGGEIMTKYIMFTDTPNKFILARRKQIKNLFKQNEITPEMIENNFYVKISWSPTDYLFPSLALRRTVVSDIRVKKLKNLTKKISNAESTKKNIKAIANTEYQGAKECKYDFSILNEPLSDVEKDLVRKQLKLPADTEITTENYPFRLGACYDQQTITKNPKNKMNIAKGLCRVVGFSGSTASFLDTALILELDWRPLYLSLIIDYVPIHHSIPEIFDALLELGFITKLEYDNKIKTIETNIAEIKTLDNFNYNYSNQINNITRGYRLKNKNTRKNNNK
jgi:hypothetical protein